MRNDIGRPCSSLHVFNLRKYPVEATLNFVPEVIYNIMLINSDDFRRKRLRWLSIGLS